MADIMIYIPLDRLLWGIVVAFLIFCGLFYLYRGRQKENFNDKIMLFGFSGYFIFMAICRVFFFLSDLSVYAENISLLTDADLLYLTEFFTKLAYFFGIMALFCILLAFEIIYRKTKYTLTGLNVILIILIIFLPYDLSKTLTYGSSVLDVGIVLVTLLLISRKSLEEFQSVSSLIFIGYLTALMGHVLDSSFVKEAYPLPSVLPPTLYLIGAIIIISPALIDPKYLSNAKIYYTIFGVFSMIISLSFLPIMLTIHFTSYISYIMFFGGFVFFIIAIASLVNVIHIFRKEKAQAPLPSGDTILGTFIKPKKVTEEEVTISKEKKICLVCKNKIQRDNYICPDCNSFYCYKCSKTLAGMENACWVCDTPFDEALPFKKTIEEPPIDEPLEIHKGKNINEEGQKK